ncbi:MAG: hypothetical protein A2052_06850 [Deltaproteobacteria bacterium GWA2_54_12]|nr:MAG: hypothetical protein A2052_06850 [Deltaproteobacteria bacterium GWA2_54_12]
MESASVNTVNNIERPGRYFKKAAGPRVLLREPEICAECNKVFVSLYAIRSCADHQGLEQI